MKPRNVYSTPTQFIFVHIPKTAGTSTLRWLNGGVVKRNCHSTALQYKKMLGQQYNSFFKFSFVRNPWDRMLSFYKYYMSYDQHTPLKHPKNEPFATWLKKVQRYKHVSKTQLSHITDNRDRLIVVHGDLYQLKRNKVQCPGVRLCDIASQRHN